MTWESVDVNSRAGTWLNQKRRLFPESDKKARLPPTGKSRAFLIDNEWER